MTAPVRCLVVTKFLPLPDNGGGKQRTLATLRRLVGRCDVVLAAYDDGEADRAAIEALGAEVLTAPWPPARSSMVRGMARSASLTAARFHDEGLIATIRQAAAHRPFDAVVVEYAQLLGWVDGVRGRRLVHASHNVESLLLRSMAGTRGAFGGLALRAEAVAVSRLERRLLREAHTVTVVSERDRQRVLAKGSGVRVAVCPNGWDPGPVLPPAAGPEVAFVAQLGWGPNIDAARWLHGAVWPHVLEARPDARLLLVGREPAPEVRALAGPAVEVTGTVPSVRPYLERARLAVAPLRAAGGSRLKILEALDAGRPVVATTLGAEGLEDLIGHGVVVADDPAALGRAIVELLDQPERAARLGREGHDVVTDRYSWDATLAPLLAVITNG